MAFVKFASLLNTETHTFCGFEVKDSHRSRYQTLSYRWSGANKSDPMYRSNLNIHTIYKAKLASKAIAKPVRNIDI